MRWFVKQDLFKMPLHDCALFYTLTGRKTPSYLLYTLLLEQPTDRTMFKEQLEVVMDESEFVLDTVRSFLV